MKDPIDYYIKEGMYRAYYWIDESKSLIQSMTWSIPTRSQAVLSGTEFGTEQVDGITYVCDNNFWKKYGIECKSLEEVRERALGHTAIMKISLDEWYADVYPALMSADIDEKQASTQTSDEA